MRSPFAVPVTLTTPLHANATYSDGNVHDYTTSSSWRSDNTSVATVGTSTGVVTGQAPGSLNAYATFPTLVVTTGQVCSGGMPVCPTAAPSLGAPGSALGVPTNFAQVGQGKDNGGGVLEFNYQWGSSTGRLSDLSACIVYEVVAYPGTTNPYVWPKPPWNGSTPNPTSTKTAGSVPATDGVGVDDSVTKSFINPYQAASFNATQDFHYHCRGLPTDGHLYGPLQIARSVSKNTNGTYKYLITKSGASATVSPLP